MGTCMNVRPIRKEEMSEVMKLQSVAFIYSVDLEKEAKENNDKADESIRGYFGDDGKLYSCIHVIPFKARFDGKDIMMGGIGGVASFPERRAGGNIKELMQYGLKEMYEKKWMWSYLYPFSFEYYRKFGYELSLNFYKATIPLDCFRHFPSSGSVKHYVPRNDDSDIKAIYRKFIEDKNLAIIRDERLWKYKLDHDPYKELQYTYIWYGNDGKPGSYIIFDVERNKDNFFDILVRELVWVDKEALEGIFAFLTKMRAQYSRVIWEVPSWLNILLIFPDPSKIQCEAIVKGMSRIVDVKEVLKAVAKPEGKGSFVVKVFDNFLDWNSGTFSVSWGPDGTEVIEHAAEPDFECTIQLLNQLCIGYAGIEEMLYSNDVKVYKNHLMLSQVFKRKKLYINNNF